MRTETANPTIRLADYQAPAYLIDHVSLTFQLLDTRTRVKARIEFKPNPNRAADGPHDLRLDGHSMTLISTAINGAPLPEGSVIVDETGLTLPFDHVPQEAFIWEAETELNPQANTSLEGLYQSKGMFCTQCEAEGFRKITYYPDRPDVMTTFTVRIEGDHPAMLSNGNLVERGDGFAQWHDPWPKPAYLFALVAGDLVSFDDSFTTASGRKVALQIFVRDGDQERCEYAMDALKRSMRWDETEYGREYDLDLFMIVAVDDFNMGAMENKGLNIFNSKYVLASPQTATDRDFELIEAIIAHEYFHNWTGNRITCRDWFQLCLKEGLTVYRDQQFSSDMRSPAVQRIENVRQLRARQFREDAGPLAHPVRPEEYIEINNFYTATVYEKGAELIGMLRLLVGPDAYRKSLDAYFERHDGQACTIEDWIKVFEDTTGRDLSHFARWYSQAGTPRLSVEEQYADGTYTLTFTQKTEPTPGQPDKKPQLIPVSYGFLGSDGTEMGEAGVLEISEASQSFSFDLPEKPVPSLLRGFSAPVILDMKQSHQDQAFLMAHDSDPFNRWEAAMRFGTDVLCALAIGTKPPDPAYLDAMKALAVDESLDPAFRALALTLPSQDILAQELANRGRIPDHLAIDAALKSLRGMLALEMGDDLERLYAQNQVTGPYVPDAEGNGKRALRAVALSLMTALDPSATAAQEQFSSAQTMGEKLGSLSLLVGRDQGKAALAEFYDSWKHDPLVLDKWFAVQAMSTPPKQAIEAVRSQLGFICWVVRDMFCLRIGC